MKQFCLYILIFANLLTVTTSAIPFEEPHSFSISSETCSYQWVARYLDSIDGDTPLDEVVDFLFSVRELLVSQGFSIPFFSEIFTKSLEELKIWQKVQIDENFLEDLYEEIISREEGRNSLVSLNLFKNTEKVKIILVKKKKKNDVKISGNFAKGFCKALGGALLCVIPSPVTQGLGIALVASGVSDMVQHADDTDGCTMEEIQRQLEERQRIGTENTSFSPNFRVLRKREKHGSNSKNVFAVFYPIKASNIQFIA